MEILALALIGFVVYKLYKNKQEEQESDVEENTDVSSPQSTEEKDDANPPRRTEEARSKKMRIKKDRIVDQWQTIIEGANGKGAELSKEIGRILEETAVPNLILRRRDVSLGGLSQFLKGSRKLLVAENKYLKGYRIFIGTHDYGKQLSVSWYLTVEQSFMGRLAAASEVSAVMAILLYPVILLMRIFHFGRGYVMPETMDLFDLEELRAYTATVHGAVKKATAELMQNMDLDFSKVNTQTRGLINIS